MSITLQYSQIPSWLHESDLFKNLNKQDNDQIIIVPSKCYKENLEINNLEDAVLLFHTCDYWNILIPKELDKYILNNWQYQCINLSWKLNVHFKDYDVNPILHYLANLQDSNYEFINFEGNISVDTMGCINKYIRINIIDINSNIFNYFKFNYFKFNFNDVEKFLDDLKNNKDCLFLFEKQSLCYLKEYEKIGEYLRYFKLDPSEYMDPPKDSHKNPYSNIFSLGTIPIGTILPAGSILIDSNITLPTLPVDFLYWNSENKLWELEDLRSMGFKLKGDIFTINGVYDFNDLKTKRVSVKIRDKKDLYRTLYLLFRNIAIDVSKNPRWKK